MVNVRWRVRGQTDPWPSSDKLLTGFPRTTLPVRLASWRSFAAVAESTHFGLRAVGETLVGTNTKFSLVALLTNWLFRVFVFAFLTGSAVVFDGDFFLV